VFEVIRIKESLKVRNTQGFSILELLIVVSVLAIVSGTSMILIGPALKARAEEMAARIVTVEMRRARQVAVDTRRLIKVTFTAPQTITVEWQSPGAGGWNPLSQTVLPEEMEFLIDGALDSGPEGFGYSSAINFSIGAQEIFFLPDGSAIDSSGVISSGVVYVSRPGEVESTRAVTLFGATGRLKHWKYIEAAESWE